MTDKKLILYVAIGIVLGLAFFNLINITIDRLITNHHEYQDCKLYEDWYETQNTCPKSNANSVCRYFGEKSFVATCIEFGVVDKISDSVSSGVGIYYLRDKFEESNGSYTGFKINDK